MSHIHVHAPSSTAKRTVACACPDCKRRTRLVEFFTPWYGWQSTCLRCGRVWSDGEWQALPFMRGARQSNIDRARSHWRRLPPRSQNHFGVDR